MTQLFLIAILFLGLVYYPIFMYQTTRRFLTDAFAAETRYSRVINWIGFGLSAVLFLISGTVALNVLITLLTGGTISVP
ncbi:hypothetical protein SEA_PAULODIABOLI_279 [Microbacterium phage PauloDiaboli]|nr:hypothetical protein SEA_PAULODIABOLI_279 [Microbacterium phage PauloDiaboli]QWY84086.1 hypothetical protein SEA_A3WALLY_279 [Microbacterium phage A3Wally]